MANYLNRSRHYGLKVLLDGLLLAASFFLAYGLKRQTLVLDNAFLRFLSILFVSWLLITVLSKKFYLIDTRDYFRMIRPFWQSAVVLMVALTMILYMIEGVILSRLIVYGTLTMFCFSEIVILTVYWFLFPKNVGRMKPTRSILIFLLELVFINITFFGLYFLIKNTNRFSEHYQLALLGICVTWLIASLMFHRFRVSSPAVLLSMINPIWKSEVLIALVVCLAVLVFKIKKTPRTIILGSLFAFIVFENLILLVIHLFGKKRLLKNDDAGGIENSRIAERDIGFEKWWGKPAEKYHYNNGLFHSDLLKRKLQTTYLSKFPDLYHFLDEILDLSSFPLLESVFLYSPHLYNIDVLDNNSLGFFLNFEQVNNIRRINQAFIAVNERLKVGGIMVGCYQSLEQRKELIYERYPRFLNKAVNLIDFVFSRIMPKIPVAKKIYFALSKGFDRALSNTELGGRLYYCGFEILALKRIKHHLYFIARKVKNPSTDPHPSYGIFFKQRRVGLGGKIIHVYKARTMHPFAEYLHTEIMKRNDLESSGKVSNDIRIASWGRKLRAVYFDEMPMLVNWLCMELKFVGVRPLSESFFSTYPEDLKKERIKVKPGVFPPYYADLPGSIEEVWESERKYIQRFLKHPLRTDISYFFRGIYNIIFRHARSA